MIYIENYLLFIYIFLIIIFIIFIKIKSESEKRESFNVDIMVIDSKVLVNFFFC